MELLAVAPAASHCEDKECQGDATPAHTPGKSLGTLMEKNLTVSAVY